MMGTHGSVAWQKIGQPPSLNPWKQSASPFETTNRANPFGSSKRAKPFLEATKPGVQTRSSSSLPSNSSAKSSNSDDDRFRDARFEGKLGVEPTTVGAIGLDGDVAGA
eukprot:m.51604 g.51604  ORF g.51604 m.51604 type:complete len:108 (-) comp12236_c0_seq1:2221-2544(-)